LLLLLQQLLLLALTLSDLQQSYTVMLMPTARKCCLIDRRVARAAGSDASVCVYQPSAVPGPLSPQCLCAYASTTIIALQPI